jgi:hypothetical protein
MSGQRSDSHCNYYNKYASPTQGPTPVHPSCMRVCHHNDSNCHRDTAGFRECMRRACTTQSKLVKSNIGHGNAWDHCARKHCTTVSAQLSNT